jgi:hypothetical protein
MMESIQQVVLRTIDHAERMARSGDYDWPTARDALLKILADLEVRSPTSEERLAPLRDYIARRDHEAREQKGGAE